MDKGSSVQQHSFSKVDLSLKWYEISLIIFGIIYSLLIYSTHLPLSGLLLGIFCENAVELLLFVMLLSIPLVALRTVYFKKMCGKTYSLAFHQAAYPYWTLDFLVLTLRRAIAIIGAIYFFLHLKHLILWLNPTNNDLFLWELDQKIHFGIQPNVRAMQVIASSPTLAVILDWLYIKYFDYKVIVSLIFLLEPRGRGLSDAYFTAYSLTWFLGGLAYLALPADGPCYAFLINQSIPAEERGHVFNYPLTTDVPKDYLQNYADSKIVSAKYFQHKLWVDRRAFLQGKRFPGVFYGIAAMPSLHVAAVTMMALFLLRASVIAGAIGIFYAITTFVGSIFLQWHYATDGYAGAVLGLVTVFIGLRLTKTTPAQLFQKKK